MYGIYKRDYCWLFRKSKTNFTIHLIILFDDKVHVIFRPKHIIYKNIFEKNIEQRWSEGSGFFFYYFKQVYKRLCSSYIYWLFVVCIPISVTMETYTRYDFSGFFILYILKPKKLYMYFYTYKQHAHSTGGSSPKFIIENLFDDDDNDDDFMVDMVVWW